MNKLRCKPATHEQANGAEAEERERGGFGNGDRRTQCVVGKRLCSGRIAAARNLQPSVCRAGRKPKANNGEEGSASQRIGCRVARRIGTGPNNLRTCVSELIESNGVVSTPE